MCLYNFVSSLARYRVLVIFGRYFPVRNLDRITDLVKNSSVTVEKSISHERSNCQIKWILISNSFPSNIRAIRDSAKFHNMKQWTRSRGLNYPIIKSVNFWRQFPQIRHRRCTNKPSSSRPSEINVQLFAQFTQTNTYLILISRCRPILHFVTIHFGVFLRLKYPALFQAIFGKSSNRKITFLRHEASHHSLIPSMLKIF